MGASFSDHELFVNGMAHRTFARTRGRPGYSGLLSTRLLILAPSEGDVCLSYVEIGNNDNIKGLNPTNTCWKLGAAG